MHLTLPFITALLFLQERPFEDPRPPEASPIEPQPSRPAPHATSALHEIAAPRPLSVNARVENWPAFQGPRRDAVCRETCLDLEFGEGGPRLLWEYETGAGYAAPSVQGNVLVFPHRLGDELVVDALDPATGRQSWTHRSPTSYEDPFGFGNGPKCAPTLTRDRAFVLGVDGRLLCLHLQTGRVLWQRDLWEEFGIPEPFFGVGSSPLLWKDRVVINVGAPGGPCVAAFDQSTGRMVWGAGRSWFASYASPVLANVNGRDLVLVFGGGKSRPPVGGLSVIDAASGELLAERSWRSRVYYSVNAATPLVQGRRVLLTESYGKGALLLEITDDFQLREVWQNPDFDLHFGSAQLHDGHLFGFAGQKQPASELACIDFETGAASFRQRLEWQESIEASRGTVVKSFTPGRAHLLRIADTFLCLGEDGHLLELELTAEACRIRQRSWLFAAPESWTPLVVSHGLLYVCQNNRDSLNDTSPRLRCYDLRGE